MLQVARQAWHKCRQVVAVTPVEAKRHGSVGARKGDHPLVDVRQRKVRNVLAACIQCLPLACALLFRYHDGNQLKGIVTARHAKFKMVKESLEMCHWTHAWLFIGAALSKSTGFRLRQSITTRSACLPAARCYQGC